MIHWKPAQRLLVAQKSYSILIDPMYVGSKIEAVRMAMESELPKELHRDLKGMQQVVWITDAWKQLEDSGFKPSPVIQGASNHDIEHEIRESVKTTALADMTLHDLMMEVARRVQDMTDPKHLLKLVRDEVNATLEARMPGMLPPDPREATIEIEQREEVESRKRVLILGLNPPQQNIVRTRYNKFLDLHFMDGDEGATRIKNAVSVMDYSLKSQWCKGHLGSTKGWPNFSSATGGIATIQRLLNQRFKLTV